ncbi:ogr/Delta-like zinc finger family protein [Duganella sp. SG902]|uniref:ogr/Delta-like zinc finger family protein n=1 Tax=Duganella sp. SG902 TaxID=2587016 RepID=UPI0035A6D424
MSLRITIRCPHCEARAVARSSQKMSDTMREITYVCTNPLCGHTYVAGLEVLRTLSPSAMPRRGINIPFSPHVARELLMEQLQLI